MLDSVFYVALALRHRQLGELREAAIMASITMVAPAMSAVVMVDVISSAFFGNAPLFKIIDKWLYLLPLFFMLYVMHHVYFVSGERYKRIFDKYSTISSGRLACVTVLALYFVLPIFLCIFVVYRFG